jgi:hypothetical protein
VNQEVVPAADSETRTLEFLSACLSLGFLIPKMGAVHSSEVLVNLGLSIQCHNLETNIVYSSHYGANHGITPTYRSHHGSGEPRHSSRIS